MKVDKELFQSLQKLQEKYQPMGQDMPSYLEGLLYSNFQSYWDYIRLDVLLGLQKPNSDFPDELVFIIYHQITELYFKLVLHELHQVTHNGRNILPTGEDKGWNSELSADLFIEKLVRINRYFDNLIRSFDVMTEGMEKEQFQRFRMALLPASGFQSAQYRMIEICSCDFLRLLPADAAKKYGKKKPPSINEMFEHIYWKQGATELATGKKTLTLAHFEKKYSGLLIEMAGEYSTKNLWKKYKSLSSEDQKNELLIQELRIFDANLNINWPLAHYKSVVRYLFMETREIRATGGTNWQKYLPPKFQKQIFYPELWSIEEQESWGKHWVERIGK